MPRSSEFSGTREAGSSDGQDAIETRVSTDTLTRLVNLANLGELRPQQRSPSSRNAALAGGFPARWRARLAACAEAAADPENPSGPLCYSRHFAAPLAETGFDWGVRRFGYLLTSAMLIMVLLGFVVHMFGGRPRLETLLFAILTPELLDEIYGAPVAYHVHDEWMLILRLARPGRNSRSRWHRESSTPSSCSRAFVTDSPSGHHVATPRPAIGCCCRHPACSLGAVIEVAHSEQTGTKVAERLLGASTKLALASYHGREDTRRNVMSEETKVSGSQADIGNAVSAGAEPGAAKTVESSEPMQGVLDTLKKHPLGTIAAGAAMGMLIEEEIALGILAGIGLTALFATRTGPEARREVTAKVEEILGRARSRLQARSSQGTSAPSPEPPPHPEVRTPQ